MLLLQIKKGHKSFAILSIKKWTLFLLPLNPDCPTNKLGFEQMLYQLWNWPWEGLVSSRLRGRQSHALKQHRLFCGGRVAWRMKTLPANTDPRTQIWGQGFLGSPSSGFQCHHRSNP